MYQRNQWSTSGYVPIFIRMKVLLGKKIEMTQVFKEDGSVVPVTLVSVGPCTVTSVHTAPSGKTMVQLGTGTQKHPAKPQAGAWKELGSFALVREFPLEEGEAPARGSVIDLSVFSEGDLIDVVGTSKGRGFQGVVHRHGFAGQPSTHGHKDQSRKSGSIGAGGIQRVFKGMRMAGHMGDARVTVKNLEVVKIDKEQGTIAVKGAIPGARGSFVTLVSTDGNVWH